MNHSFPHCPLGIFCPQKLDCQYRHVKDCPLSPKCPYPNCSYYHPLTIPPPVPHPPPRPTPAKVSPPLADPTATQRLQRLEARVQVLQTDLSTLSIQFAAMANTVMPATQHSQENKRETSQETKLNEEPILTISEDPVNNGEVKEDNLRASPDVPTGAKHNLDSRKGKQKTKQSEGWLAKLWSKEEPDLKNRQEGLVHAVASHSPESDTDILNKFIIETFEPQQVQVNNRLGTLESMMDDIENIYTEISKIQNLEKQISTLNSSVPEKDLEHKVQEESDKIRKCSKKNFDNLTEYVEGSIQDTDKQLTELEERMKKYTTDQVTKQTTNMESKTTTKFTAI